jgi:hypothetical protein
MITLATLEEATEQEIFNQVAEHLLKQNQRSETLKQCYYRYNGLSCAAGCLISDTEFDEIMKDEPGINCKSWDDMILHGFATSTHKNFIRRLQIIHDTVNVSDWRHELNIFANDNDLYFKF